MLRALFLPVSTRVRGRGREKSKPYFTFFVLLHVCFLITHQILWYCSVDTEKKKECCFYFPYLWGKQSSSQRNVLDHFITSEDFTRNSTFAESDFHPNAIDFTHSRKVIGRHEVTSVMKSGGWFPKTNHWSAKSCLQKGKTKHVCFEKLEDY